MNENNRDALESENSVSSSVSWHGKIVLALSCLGPLFQFRLELVWTAGGGVSVRGKK